MRTLEQTTQEILQLAEKQFKVADGSTVDAVIFNGGYGIDYVQFAADIMQKAQPLPPIPDRMHTDRVDGTLPINFGVRSFSAGSSAGSCR